MGAGMSTLGGGIAGVMSGIEVGQERGMASGLAQGAISGSLSTVGGLLLGPIGTVLGKMLGDAIGKAAFGLGDWMAKHFNIFEIVDKYILSPIQNIFRTIGNVITDIKNGIVSAITSVLPDWAKKLIGITDTKPQSEGDKIREQMKRDPEAAFKEAQFQAAKRSKINRESGGDEVDNKNIKSPSISEIVQSFLLSRSQDEISDSFHGNSTILPSMAPAAGQKSISQRMASFASNVGEKIASVFNGSGALPTDSSVVTSEFGPRNTGLVGASTFHKGIDLRAPMGSPIYAMQQGTVSGINDKWGKVILKHPNNYTSEYAHLSGYNVKPGDIVQKGQRIGSAGKTGPIPGMAPHLHHTIKAPDGTAINPRSFYEQIGINLQQKGGNQISNREVGGPNLNMKHVAKMQADKDMTTANLFNESTKGIQNSLQDSMNHSGKQTAVIVNSMTNSISSSMNSLAKSVSGGGGGGSNQGNDEISAILSGRMQ
jgi:murein DD-endopeptidase MepM/ murein hydrolase activator NlpD